MLFQNKEYILSSASEASVKLKIGSAPFLPIKLHLFTQQASMSMAETYFYTGLIGAFLHFLSVMYLKENKYLVRNGISVIPNK